MDTTTAMGMNKMSTFSEAECLKYKDPKQPLNVRIEDLMQRMTLEEEIGQMIQLERNVASPDVMKQYFIVVEEVSKPNASAADWMEMVNNIQKAIGLSGYESYSEDHTIVQSMTEIIPGLQGDLPADSKRGIPFVAGKEKVAACAKHFVGDGGTTRGIDQSNTVDDAKEQFSIHIPAYYDSISKGVATIMISFSSWNGTKMHANRDLITGFLKDILKFEGFVISDYEGIDMLTSPPRQNYTYSVQAGVLAGIDMFMIPDKFLEFINNLTSLVKSNVIPMTRIDDAIRRILSVKFVMGLFEDPLADPSLAKHLGSQEHRELARETMLWWLPGSEGQGVADVLFGDYGFSGKLARNWFKSVDQLPMNVGDAHYDPLFPFGFGLTTQPKHYA
ncbi:hypothetical protein SASPL_101355 [Salvia splendens]|uniref:beta-glucosidase n=1 Tax=Salvia splendens TaxID=180675 RepID=A0A8X8YUE6_SALSN|nr:hypothetical protein SASPL_101355 [Salvia splendens]